MILLNFKKNKKFALLMNGLGFNYGAWDQVDANLPSKIPTLNFQIKYTNQANLYGTSCRRYLTTYSNRPNQIFNTRAGKYDLPLDDETYAFLKQNERLIRQYIFLGLL
jgi:hypothetical protein